MTRGVALGFILVLVGCGNPAGQTVDAPGGGDDTVGGNDASPLVDAPTSDGWMPGDAAEPNSACASGALVSGRVLATTTSGDELVFDHIEIGAGGALFAGGQLAGRATLEAGTPNSRVVQGSQIGSSVVAKYAANGGFAWASSMSSRVGWLTALRPLADGSVLVGGYFTEQLAIDYGTATQILLPAVGTGYNIYIAKLDPDGHAVWAHSAASGAIDGIFSIAARPDGSFVAAGYFGDGSQHTFAFPDGQNGPVAATATDMWESGWVGSFDAQGRIGWLRTLGGSSRKDAVSFVTFASNGDLLLAGSFGADLTYTMASGPQTIQQTGNTSYGTSATYLARLAPATGNVISLHANGGQSTATAMLRAGGTLHLAAETDRPSAFDPSSTVPPNGAIPYASYLVSFDESFAFTKLLPLGTGFDSAKLTNLGDDAFLFSGTGSAYRRFASGPNGEIDPTPVTTPGLPPGFIACASATDHRIVWSTATGRSSAAAIADDGSIVAFVTFSQTVTINAGKPSAQTFTNGGFGRTSLLVRFAP